jgi:hypothetical protein
MFRTAAYVALVAGFVAFAYVGLSGWMHTHDAEPTSAEPAPEDEHAPRTGFLAGKALGHFGSMGYPWISRRDELLAAKRDLPPDPAPLSADEAEKENRKILFDLKFRLPAGRILWRDLVPLVREKLEPHGVKLTTGTPKIADDYPLDLPDVEWTGLSIFGHVMKVTEKSIVYTVTSEGVNFGTDEACNKATRDAALIAARRRVAAENAADTRLDAEFRPDVQDANIVAFVRGIEAQTGVGVAIDVQIWEMGPALSWHAPPMKLREALDQLCRAFRWYWRTYDGHVWLLRP